MEKEIVAAIITVCGVLFTALITIITYIFTRKYDYHRLYAETVSQSRNKWLNEMRDFISTMLAEAENINSQNPNNSEPQTNYEYFKARNEILLRLNLKEEEHRLLKENIQMLDTAIFNCSGQFDCLKKNIITVSQKILKDEWEKVKKEAKGERR